MKKTLIFSNLAVSVDGKIATASREHFPIGSKKDLARMRLIRNRADAVVMGAETLRAWQKPCLPIKIKPIWNSIVSHSLDGVDPSWPFFKSTKVRRLLLISGKVSAARRKEFEKTSTLVNLNSRTSIGKQIIRAHRKLGLTQILVEGGGGLMWEFVRENLIDRYYVTIAPRIMGGKGAPSLVDGAGLSPVDVVNLKLEKSERVGSEIFLVYNKLTQRGKKHPLYR